MGDTTDMIQKMAELFFKNTDHYMEKTALNVIKYLIGEYYKLKTSSYKAFMDVCSSIEDNQWLTMTSAFVKSGVITEGDASAIYKLRNLAHPLDWIMYFFVTVKLFLGFLSVRTEANLAKQSQAINKEERPYIPNYNDVINAAFIAPEKTGEVKEYMKKTGLPDEAIDLLFLSRYNLYPVETIKELYLRGIIDNGKMFVRMRELGFTDTRIREMVQAWEVIPGPQDLFWMVGKEAFEPDMIKHIGLGDEFPSEQLEWLKKQGISSDWAHKYWYAHWDEPSIQQGYEMLHRGVIDDEELDMLFRAIEMPPFWREKLKEVAYRPLSRVDVRRMHKLGVIGDNRLVRAYTDLGYNEENALAMAQFTVLHNQSTGISLTKSQIISSYRDGMLNRTDAYDLLLGIDLTDDEAEFLLYHEDHKKEEALTKRKIKVVGDRFKLGTITEIDVRSALGKLNLLSEKIELLIEEWQIDIDEAIAIPSKTDLNKFYINDIINEDEYRAEMRKLGYTSVAIGWYLKSIEKTVKSV